MRGEGQIRKNLKAGSDLHQKIVDSCKQIAGSMQISGISIFDCHANGTLSTETIEVILVILDYLPRLASYVRTINGRNVVIFVVDQWIFERDIERGFLGEATVGTLVFPHTAIMGKDYLFEQEIRLKKRLVSELLENLVIGFPALAEQMRIKPEYFVYETILSRVRVFPPLAHCATGLIKEIEATNSPVLASYMAALKKLEEEERIEFSNGYIRIPIGFLPRKGRSRVKLANISKNAPRTIFTSLFEAFPQLLSFLSKSTERGFALRTNARRKKEDNEKLFVDPQRFIFLPTSGGLVSLADRVSVNNFARKMLLDNKKGEIILQPIGGLLNDVYIAAASLEGNEKRILIKRFKDWSGIKWFPLNMWALGARTFAVLGQTRLENECTTSELLHKQGFNVPRILHVSHSKRLVFMEYIEGYNLKTTLRKLANAKDKEKAKKELAIVFEIGGTLARVHSSNIALGDTKPENVMIDPSGRVYLLDFEQASVDGDKTWDIAEFLYYSGHYLSPLQGSGNAQAFSEAFVEGYLSAGGNPEVVRRAGLPKYTRVFSIFIMPAVLLTISKICRNISKNPGEKRQPMR